MFILNIDPADISYDSEEDSEENFTEENENEEAPSMIKNLQKIDWK
jgi:hypothetical protein